jgi:hypothetical protein
MIYQMKVTPPILTGKDLATHQTALSASSALTQKPLSQTSEKQIFSQIA